jgi:hypothetical protein
MLNRDEKNVNGGALKFRNKSVNTLRIANSRDALAIVVVLYTWNPLHLFCRVTRFSKKIITIMEVVCTL